MIMLEHAAGGSKGEIMRCLPTPTHAMCVRTLNAIQIFSQPDHQMVGSYPLAIRLHLHLPLRSRSTHVTSFPPEACAANFLSFVTQVAVVPDLLFFCHCPLRSGLPRAALRSPPGCRTGHLVTCRSPGLSPPPTDVFFASAAMILRCWHYILGVFALG
jgi:hypothetical protein